MSSAPLRRVISRALRAASRARAASIILVTTLRASSGCSSRYSVNSRPSSCSTAVFTSLDTSLSLVCDENFGSGTFTDTTAVSPSRASSPVVETWAFFRSPSRSMYWFSVRVRPPRKPAMCVPPVAPGGCCSCTRRPAPGSCRSTAWRSPRQCRPRVRSRSERCR